MEKRNLSTSDILRALGYTASTLSTDIDVTVSQARRILTPNGTIYLKELREICRTTGISMNIFSGEFIPGVNRAVLQERRRQQEEEAQEREKRRAQNQEEYNALPRDEKITRLCSILVPAVMGIVKDYPKLTYSEVLAELHRQCAAEGEATA